MPTSAIATGNVDFVLSPEKIAEKSLNLSRNPMFVCPQPLISTDGSSLLHQSSTNERQAALEQIFSLLLANTGIDFSHYKFNTLDRRIQRRMLLCRVEQLADYASYLQAHPAEIKALSEEIFIHVTSFFRDPAAFELLKTKVFPTITQHKSASPIRIWVAGCSTGEEVYSIAMCLLEFLADRVTLPSIQILATDISESSLERARASIYNDSIQLCNRDDFLSNLSHELRNPLTAIIGWAQLLQTHKLAEATVTHGLEVIYRNAKVQSQSIDNMLNPFQLTSDKQLPLEAVPSDLAAETGKSVTEEVSLLEGLHILAVDDEPHILDLVKYILEDAGAAVTTVTSTRDALSSLVTSGVKYDALLTDIGMPDEDGLALIGRVRALDTKAGGQIPAAAITAYGSDRERQQAIDAGFQVHLAKPFYAEQLVQTVANLTERVKVT
jgi:CheY-like chemotaxis protein